MNDIAKSITTLNDMVLNGQALEAFDRFYADDVVMQEEDQAPTVGKAENRDREVEFFSKITEFRGAEVRSVAVGDDVSMVEWRFDFTHEDWGDQAYDQVAVQRWRDGEIVSERFYKAG